MKTFICILAVFALAQARGDWDKFPRKELFAPVKGLPMWNSGRIIGGQEAIPHQFPYQMALRASSPSGGWFCGASLISRRTVLTAAHCADGASSIEIVMGAHDVTVNEPSQVVMRTRNYKVHEGWSWDTLANDIALVILEQDAPLNSNIAILGLPRRSDAGNTFAGELATISGWGKNSDHAGGITPRLQYVSADVITNQECSQYFGSSILPTTICASGAGHKSTCNGDSGGPLTVTENGRTFQIGVTSFVSGLGCEASYPHAYTRVTKYLDWIQSNSDVQIN